MDFGKNKSNFYRLFFSVFIYGALVFLVLGTIHLDIYNFEGKELYTEKSFTEAAQLLSLFIISVIYIWVARKYPEWKALAFSLAVCSIIAFIRENDRWLDSYVFDGAWQTLALLTAVIFLVPIFKNLKKLEAHLQSFLQSTSYGFTVSGFLVVFIFSRIFGRSAFWQTIMAENYIRSVKNVAEEATELLGYILLLMGAIEFLIFVKHSKQLRKRQRNIQIDDNQTILADANQTAIHADANQAIHADVV